MISILWTGRLDDRAVRTADVGERVVRADKIEAVIADGWREQKEVAQRKNFEFYNGPLVRFEGFEITPTGLAMNFSRGIFYRDVVGLRARLQCASQVGLKRRCEPNAFSLFNVLVTADEKIPFGLRRSGDWDESYELSGGFLRVDEIQSLETSSLNRLRDDFSIMPGDLTEQAAITLYEQPTIFETTLLFICRTN